MLQLNILKAIPGAGKSTLISRIEKEYGKPAYVCSADDYWYFGKEKIPENYLFDIKKAHIAHQVCREKFLAALSDKEPHIVIDNTNINPKDYNYYFTNGIKNGYNVVFHTIVNCSVEESVKNNVHKVPRFVIGNMLKNFKPTPKEIDGVLTDEVVYDFYELRGIKNGNTNKETKENSNWT